MRLTDKAVTNEANADEANTNGADKAHADAANSDAEEADANKSTALLVAVADGTMLSQKSLQAPLRCHVSESNAARLARARQLLACTALTQ